MTEKEKKDLFYKWRKENEVNNMTGTEVDFANFLFDNFEQLTPIGNVKIIFDSIYDFANKNR